MTTTATASAAEDVLHRVAEAPRREADAYRDGHDRPLGAYAVLLTIYGSLTALLALVVRRRDALPDRIATRDLVQLGLATHKLSRLVTKESVGAVARAPFTTFVEATGEGEVHEEVRGDGLRHAAGELVTCPFCFGVWVATGLAFGLVLAPRATRLVTTVLTAVTASDYLQLAYATLQRVAEGD